jgi:hypothetical protein
MKRRRFALPLVLVAVLLGAGVTGGQAAQPAWADDYYTDLNGWTDDYNAHAGTSGVDFPGHTLLRDERVNLFVAAEDGSVATFSFDTDDRLRIVDLQQGTRDDVTVNVRAKKGVLARIASKDDPVAALGNAILAGEVRIERVVSVMGMAVALGATGTVLGVLGVVGAAFALAKVGGDGIVAGVKGLLSTPMKLLNGILGLLTALDLLVLDVRKRTRALMGRLRRSSSDEEAPIDTDPSVDSDPPSPSKREPH